ncbi:MAG TPA: ferrous iron transport protein A [Actinomycetales bacterium]|nr:ferrous iron transport protein A [Actinomycetales bacterium]
MSQLSEQLRQREINTPCPRLSGHHASLEALKPGEAGTICGICDLVRPDTARRLFDLGFVPGTTITKLRQDTFGRTMIVDIGGYELALRGAQARCITVQLAVSAAA